MLSILSLAGKAEIEEGPEVSAGYSFIIFSPDIGVPLAIVLVCQICFMFFFFAWPQMTDISSCDFQVLSPIVDPTITEKEALKFKVRMSKVLKFPSFSSV